MATKSSLKERICAASKSIALVPFRTIGQMLVNFSGVDISGKEKESCCLVFLSLTKCEISTVVVVVFISAFLYMCAQ